MDSEANVEMVHDLIFRLREEILSAEAEPVEEAEEGAALDALDGLLAGRSAPVGLEVVDAVDDLLADGGFLSVSQREQLVSGARRGIEWRQALNGPLTRLLRAERSERDLDLDELAGRLGLAAERVLDLEWARVPLTDETPETVAAWIAVVGADTDAALSALERTLGLASDHAFVGSRRETAKPSGKAKKYYRKVERILREPDEAEATE